MRLDNHFAALRELLSILFASLLPLSLRFAIQETIG